MNLSELTGIKLWGVLVLAGGIITGALYFTVFKSTRDQNQAARTKLQAKMRENAELEAYRPKLADIERQLTNLKQQLEIEKRIVPDDKNVDDFMRMVSGEARKAGIEVRRFTSRPFASRDFYTEVPFDLELDGPYYSVLNFFDRVGKLERIINVSSLQLASLKKGGKYNYAPGESVSGTCTAITFFSHDRPPASSGTPGAKGK